MHIFWNKIVKITSALGPPFTSGSWGLCPQTPMLLLLPTIASLVKFICSTKRILLLSKKEQNKQ